MAIHSIVVVAAQTGKPIKIIEDIMKKCLAKRLTEDFSGCVELYPICQFAEKFGFSYHCTHPNHQKFVEYTYTYKSSADMIRLYHELRETRREQFHTKLGISVDEHYLNTMSSMKAGAVATASKHISTS